MLEWIQSIDVSILLFFNQNLRSDILDFLFPYFTNLHKITWVQFFVIPVLGIWWLYKSRLSAVRVFAALLITAGLSDTLGYRLLKPHLNRVRPNNNPIVQSQLRLLSHPGSHSFPSNHSMNSFAVATVATIYYPFLGWVLFPLASVIAMFRMYAGVHYPTDLIAGAILGALLGWLLQRYLFKKFKLFMK